LLNSARGSVARLETRKEERSQTEQKDFAPIDRRIFSNAMTPDIPEPSASRRHQFPFVQMTRTGVVNGMFPNANGNKA